MEESAEGSSWRMGLSKLGQDSVSKAESKTILCCSLASKFVFSKY